LQRVRALVSQRSNGALRPPQATRIFTEAEEEQLTQLTGFSEADLATTLDGCAYLLDQGAYRGVNATVLSQQLQEAGMSVEHVRRVAWALGYRARAQKYHYLVCLVCDSYRSRRVSLRL
jgi:hypothetical protein